MSKQQILTVQGAMIPVILNRLGYKHHLSRPLVFGPRLFGGLGLTHLQTMKDTLQINLLTIHLHTPRQPSTLAKINLNRIQFTAGVSYPIFEHPKIHLSHSKGTWLPHFRSLLSNLDASILCARC